MDLFERLKETCLPEYDDFYSELDQSNISKSDYQHAQKVWNTFKIINMNEFQDLYVKSDTLQLADVFESFRNMCIETYQLDPCYFVSAPGFAREACLKKTEQQLELLTDMNMLLLFEKGIRGGITHVIHKYATSNNKYRSNYDKNKQSNYLVYLDANSLYG